MLAMNMFFLQGGTFGLTVLRRRTNVSGARKLKTWLLNVNEDGAGLDTRMRKIESVEFSDTKISSVGRSTTPEGKVLLVFHAVNPASLPSSLYVEVTGN
jgi:hypothetical protein